MLATIDTTDFLYTCPIHLTDPGFAIRVEETVPKVGPSAEEIAKVKQEWEKQKRKKEKEKEKENKTKVAKDSEDNERRDKESDDQKKTGSQDVTQAPASGPSMPAPKATHERYVLHRDIFALRVDLQRKRRQAAAAKTLAPRLPGVPNA